MTGRVFFASKPSQALPRQLSQRESQAVKSVAKALGEMRKFPAVLLALPLGEVDLRSKDGEGACPIPSAKALRIGGGCAYILYTLYRQRETQTGIDGGLYYPAESALRCQEFPCKILSRKISMIFGDCYKTQNIVVFCLTCH